jgi:phthalate 4,5-cis-dihydrodiol dehydrogenase
VEDPQGGGVIWRQAPHQIEAVRWLGGGLVRSVRAVTGRWRPEFSHASGYYTALLEFEDGVSAALVYNGYGYFDSVELVSWGEDRSIESRQARRRDFLAGNVDIPQFREAARFGAVVDGEPRVPWDSLPTERGDRPRYWLPGNQGIFVVTCQDGDIRKSPEGIYIYDDGGKREVPVPGVYPPGLGMQFLDSEAMELYDAIRSGKTMLHDGRWGMATIEAQWAIIESAKQRREILLQHQVAVPEGW